MLLLLAAGGLLLVVLLLVLVGGRGHKEPAPPPQPPAAEAASRALLLLQAVLRAGLSGLRTPWLRPAQQPGVQLWAGPLHNTGRPDHRQARAILTQPPLNTGPAPSPGSHAPPAHSLGSYTHPSAGAIDSPLTPSAHPSLLMLS